MRSGGVEEWRATASDEKLTRGGQTQTGKVPLRISERISSDPTVTPTGLGDDKNVTKLIRGNLLEKCEKTLFHYA